MKYEVHVVGEDDLPQGIKRVIVERVGADPLLILTESVAQNWLFIQKWEEDSQRRADVLELRPAG